MVHHNYKSMSYMAQDTKSMQYQTTNIHKVIIDSTLSVE